MLKYNLSDFYWLYFYTIIFWSLLFYVLKYLIKKKFKNTNSIKLLYFFLVAISFSFLGLSIGLLVGISLTPVIGVVIPALLTFFGGFITYIFIFGKKTQDEGYLMSTIIISLSFFLILGSDYAASIRNIYEKNKAIYDETEKREFEIFKNKLQKENVIFDSPSLNSDTIKKTEIRK